MNAPLWAEIAIGVVVVLVAIAVALVLAWPGQAGDDHELPTEPFHFEDEQ